MSAAFWRRTLSSKVRKGLPVPMLTLGRSTGGRSVSKWTDCMMSRSAGRSPCIKILITALSVPEWEQTSTTLVNITALRGNVCTQHVGCHARQRHLAIVAILRELKVHRSLCDADLADMQGVAFPHAHCAFQGQDKKCEFVYISSQRSDNGLFLVLGQAAIALHGHADRYAALDQHGRVGVGVGRKTTLLQAQWILRHDLRVFAHHPVKAACQCNMPVPDGRWREVILPLR